MEASGEGRERRGGSEVRCASTLTLTLQLRTDSQSEAVAIQAIRNAKGNSTCVDCGAPSECKGIAEGIGGWGPRV